MLLREAASFFKMEVCPALAVDVSGLSSLPWKVDGFGLRLAAAGLPRMLTPDDLMMTSSTDAGASTMVV